MREKELRIALVCFGGVSLAVYMHGISKEILKLVRASAALHSMKDRDARLRSTFFDTIAGPSAEYDTEAVSRLCVVCGGSRRRKWGCSTR